MVQRVTRFHIGCRCQRLQNHAIRFDLSGPAQVRRVMMRAPAQEAKGTSGLSMAKANFELLGWGAVENPAHDVGTDLFLMARDSRRFDLGLLVGAQVKSGPSYFEAPAYDDESGHRVGWWFATDQDHFDAWLDHSIPHLIVLQDVETKVSYWAHITRETVISTGKGSKILVPTGQTVDEANRDALLAVATNQRPPLAWEGSAWTGAQQLARADLLRYAMVVPRLVAPHPNAASVRATPEKCLAMVVLVRLDELQGRTHTFAAVPTMVEAAASPDWRWQLVSGLHSYLHDGDPTRLLTLARTANDASELAVGAVVAAAGLLECGRAGEATELLEEIIQRDIASPVDHAWLQAQLARAYAETGRHLEARDLALAVQILRSEFPQDASATAIAGASAQLVFALSDFGDSDLAQVITASDSTATWWRTQVLAWGLGHEADQRFIAWAGGQASERGQNELRAASLMAGFTADQGGWRRMTSLIARHQLLLTTATSSTEDVASHLTVLRLSGDERNLQAASAHVELDGPAGAVAAAAHDIDLASSTRTTVNADLTFLTTAGDVVGEADADRHVAAALAILENPTTYNQRLRPSFREYSVLKVVGSLMSASGEPTRRAVIEHILAMGGQQDQLTASGWARVVSAEPSCWTIEDAYEATKRAGDHHWELEYALLRIAAPHNPEVMTRLLSEAAVGDSKAFDALGNVRQIPTASALTLIDTVIAQIVDQRERMRSGGGYPMGGTDWGWWLAAINLCHPAAANWSALLEHLNDPLAHPDHLTKPLQLLATNTAEIPTELLPELLVAVEQMLKCPKDPWRTTNFEAIAKWAFGMLHESTGRPDDGRLFALLSGTEDDRESAALLLGLREDPAQLSTLAALAFDPTPLVRSGAAEALGTWAAHEVGGDQVHQLLDDLLQDPGSRVARRVVFGLSGALSRAAIAPHEEALLTHLSAKVRHGTRQLIDKLGATG
jgi:Domain of unknown function (DUF4365)/HEAT repeats